MEEGKVIIDSGDSGSVRISLKPAEDGSIWMSVAEIADIFCWRCFCGASD